MGNITFNINSYSYWCLSWSLSGHLNPRYNYQPTPLSKTTFILAEIIYGPTLNLTQALEISKLQSFLFKKAGFYSGQNTFSNITGVNWRTLTSLAPSTHWEFSISIIELNVKMAPEMSEFFNWLPLHLYINLVWLRLKLSVDLTWHISFIHHYNIHLSFISVHFQSFCY